MYAFDPDTIAKYHWDDIVSERKYLQRYWRTHEEMRDSGYRITYWGR